MICIHVYIHTVYSNPLGVKTETVIFGVDDITTTLSWTQQEPADVDLYNVSVVPQVPFSQGFGNITLRLSYNIVYFVSIEASVCQLQDVSSTTIMLNYGESFYSSSAVGTFQGS